jgi:amidase
MELPELTITDAQAAFARGAWTSARLCEAYLERIAAIDQAGPLLRSVIEVNPDALEIAAGLDAERAQRGPRGPLHGVPVLIKDSIDTGDRMMTTGGSLAMVGNIAPEDAHAVRLLREGGAVVLGKANLSEWSYMRSTRAVCGWSSRGGQTRNPHVLDRSPLGSSAGSAVAVAANLCLASLGAEVDGSISRPASSNGIVGIKPTVGLISRSGVMGVSPPQDTLGPMTRTVEDLAIMLSALAGYDARDPAMPADRQPVDYRAALNLDALRGARLGVARERFGTHYGTDAVIEGAIQTLASLGAEIVDPVHSSDVTLFMDPEAEMFVHDMKIALNGYFASHPASPIRSLDELIRYNEEHADSVMRYFRQEFLVRVATTPPLGDAALAALRAECRRLSRTDGIDKAMREHRLDAIVAPTDGMPAFPIDPVDGDRIDGRTFGGCSSPAAMAGYPHLTVPAGDVRGLPVGLSFYAGAYSEAKLIGYAYAFEQATRARLTPQFKATVQA